MIHWILFLKVPLKTQFVLVCVLGLRFNPRSVKGRYENKRQFKPDLSFPPEYIENIFEQKLSKFDSCWERRNLLYY